MGSMAAIIMSPGYARGGVSLFRVDGFGSTASSSGKTELFVDNIPRHKAKAISAFKSQYIPIQVFLDTHVVWLSVYTLHKGRNHFGRLPRRRP